MTSEPDISMCLKSLATADTAHAPSAHDACILQGNRKYAEHMLGIYTLVVSYRLPNFLGAEQRLPSNLQFDEWEKIALSSADKETVLFLQYAYISKEVAEGAMLGPPPSPPPPFHLYTGVRQTLCGRVQSGGH